MKTFAVDENNDLYLDKNGDIAMAYDLEAVKFVCKNVAQTKLGELIYQIDKGNPFFEAVFNGKANPSQFEIALRDNLLAVENVKQILAVVITINKDVLNYTAVILTTYGQIEIDGSV